MTVIHPHFVKAIATERVADLRRGVGPRPEDTPKAKRTRRLKRSAMRTAAVSTARPEQP